MSRKDPDSGAAAVEVAASNAERALRALQQAGLLDPARKVSQQGDRVRIPVTDECAAGEIAAPLGGDIIRDAAPVPREPTRTPHEQVIARLSGALPAALLAQVPAKWDFRGDVLLLELPDALLPHGERVARAFADVLDVKTVLQDDAGVAGELREMRARFLLGDDPVATMVENGVTFRFDASRVMFSSGNVGERKRAAELDAAGETVVDMFAGVGYFTLPLAVHARPARIHALEKNPVSFRYLQENAKLNGVDDIILPWHGDNREFPHEGIADRVLMGYFPGTAAFLPKALRLLKPSGGVLHYHDTANARSWRDDMRRALEAAADAAGFAVAIERARVVKSYRPGEAHAVIEARLTRRADAAA